MININKKYRTVSGASIRIICVDADLKHGHSVVGIVDKDILTWNADGERYHNSPFNLVEVGLYDDFKLDEPVMVKNEYDSGWSRRYFAGVSDSGCARTWPGGGTGWSCADYAVVWAYCRRPTKEELAD
jgi:hypothetical protein